MIRFSTLDVEMPPIDPMRDKAWIEAVAEKHGKTIGELYYYFCSDDKLLEINRERLGHDFYTDIVTFPLTDCETVLSSEFCISTDRIKPMLGKQHGKPSIPEISHHPVKFVA